MVSTILIFALYVLADCMTKVTWLQLKLTILDLQYQLKLQPTIIL